MKQALATAKARVSESSSNTVADREPAPRAGGGGGGGGMPDLASLASMMGGMGGGGGGGMPDLASLMQNPQMMQMYVLFFSFSFLLPFTLTHPSIRVTSSLSFSLE
jgi:small glutamine-rich tetratricopeptide repeat-containing protein alpha